MLLEAFLEPFAQLSKLVSLLGVLPRHISVISPLLLTLNNSLCFSSIKVVEHIASPRNINRNLAHLLCDGLTLSLFRLYAHLSLTYLTAVGEYF